MDRIGRLARVVRKASKLFSTGVLSSDVYGCEAMGVAPTTLRLIRRRGARATGATTAGSCCTTALAIAYGDYGDPGIAAPARMVREWLRIRGRVRRVISVCDALGSCCAQNLMIRSVGSTFEALSAR